MPLPSNLASSCTLFAVWQDFEQATVSCAMAAEQIEDAIQILLAQIVIQLGCESGKSAPSRPGSSGRSWSMACCRLLRVRMGGI